MADKTTISWTDHTFNPWWGCQKLSPGCANCYAERQAARFAPGSLWGPTGDRKSQASNYWLHPVRWNARAAKDGIRRLVFCGSMCDVFEDHAGIQDLRARLWALIDETPNLDWQLLTKRPENVWRMVPWRDRPWPANVWIGVSAENQEYAERRIPILLNFPATVRFVSAEPLLGPIDLARVDEVVGAAPVSGGIDWLIVGGESQEGCRPMQEEWAIDLVQQCKVAGVSIFVKQLGGYPHKRTDIESFPATLQLRQFPQRPSRR